MGVKKNGCNGGCQTYICKDCGKRFRSGKRLDNVSLWHEYVNSIQTLAELAVANKCSERTIRRRLSLVAASEAVRIFSRFPSGRRTLAGLYRQKNHSI